MTYLTGRGVRTGNVAVDTGAPPLQNWLLTPELPQWQSRVQITYLTGVWGARECSVRVVAVGDSPSNTLTESFVHGGLRRWV